MGGGFTNLTSPGPNTRPASDCRMHSISLKYAAAVKDDSERADHGRVLVLTATKAWKEKPDDDLRPMIRLEEDALAAWIIRGIVLPVPRTRGRRGLRCWNTIKRILEGKVLAIVPPSIRMPQHIAEKTLLSNYSNDVRARRQWKT
uniref:Uncharacterized protein n=1 Tax=Hyaloperonospora arabidopsidis (strain Emoy2) TaxID=559515 RepID=M4BZW3_HYAAE